jgi:hypothetical protein
VIASNEKKHTRGRDRKTRVKSKDWIIYTDARMDSVKIYSVFYIDKGDLKRKAEIYYPPYFTFTKLLPAVILFSTKEYPMHRGSYVSWAQLLAAKGIAAVTYQAREYENDFKSVLEYISRNENYLSVNRNKIGVLAFCGALNNYFTMSTDAINGYNLCYGIFFSGTLPPPSTYTYSFPLLLVDAGKDYKVCTRSLRRFKNQAAN